MGYSRLPSRFGINSLSIKLSILISAICLIAGISAAVLMLKSERKQLIFEEHDALKHASNSFITQFNRVIHNKEAIAQKANQVVKKQLFEFEIINKERDRTELSFASDSSIRSAAPDGLSAAFLPQVSFNPHYKNLFHNSEVLWQQVSPTLTEEFFNFYLITVDNFIRISPPNWALQVEADHKFADDIFFTLAAEDNNPAREAVWTPVYYDDIWHKWVTSLIVPVYHKGEFVGVTGSDLELSNLIKSFPLSDIEQQFFVFDQRGQILAHPKLNEGILLQEGKMNELLKTSGKISEELDALVKTVNSTGLNELADEFLEDDELHLVNIRKINSLNWYVGVYKKRSTALSALDELEIKFFGLFILYAVLVALLLHQALFQLVLKRIYTLVQAVSHFGKGQLDTPFPEVNKDEIGSLNSAFQVMALDINKLVDGLNQRIIEKEQAEKSANRLSKAVEFSGSGVAIANANFEIEYVNPKLIEMSGFENDHFLGAPLLSIISSDMQILLDDIDLDIRSRHHWRGDTVLKNKENHPIWVSLSVSPIRELDNSISSYVASAQDISFVKESQRKMEQLAYFDTLTGLANRAFFRMQLRKSMALAERGHYAFALFYFDLDEFKRINDTLGHDAGDQLLLQVANRLKQRLRAEDTVARLGGDEFAVLLSGIDDKSKAAEVAMIIQETISQPIKLGSNEVIISASIGITMAPDDSPEEDQLLKHADLAMYEAKAKGRNTYHFYNQELNAAAKERLMIENELRIAIKEQQFELYYQPQVDCRTNEVVGFEALIRWFHPTQGMISPVKFIPIAEATGLIVEIGEWVLWEACRFAKRLEEQGRGNNISINLSARQFKDSNLKALLSRILVKTSISAQSLHLELTESMLMGDVEVAINQLLELKMLGVSLSIDDFGTGYSSLSYLKRFPVDILKVDRSFVKDIPADSNDMEITAAIIAMAQKLNLNVVAEGVETSEQITFLKNNNCYIVQGYFFSPPLAEAQVPELYKQLALKAIC
ncbi:bifunctional diguanylate cyclase/phosphodiesterase [Pseudoalteromonas tunicata]|uniref:bifunctional diguanylate cyclase/phosphodiesterase n=1 Tax=Pseudoalteromonas tunicata TaxID=314281 RepID=UPI00273E03F0|nr:EAL domain-containing protein [Pseudoalteromonas tunicata]MDP4985149.1 EAL domain-containing protein [Pseudoalteromonas tunicata]MDP5212966.1 EAL domain-containing protein [Pseudoalteromonas tunicata]